MTQTNNRFFDEIGRLMNDAAGAAQGVKREVDAVVRNQAEKILRDLDIVKREEFEAVKDMARLAREENEALKARIAALEAKLGALRRSKCCHLSPRGKRSHADATVRGRARSFLAPIAAPSPSRKLASSRLATPPSRGG